MTKRGQVNPTLPVPY